jgi:hypothetical protein
MRPEEITAFGDLVGEAAAAGAAQIRELHEGIAARVWSAVGPAAIDGTPSDAASSARSTASTGTGSSGAATASR